MEDDGERMGKKYAAESLDVKGGGAVHNNIRLPDWVLGSTTKNNRVRSSGHESERTTQNNRVRLSIHPNKKEWDWKDFKWGGVDEDWSSDGD